MNKAEKVRRFDRLIHALVIGRERIAGVRRPPGLRAIGRPPKSLTVKQKARFYDLIAAAPRLERLPLAVELGLECEAER